jgi:cytochrome c oxidase cbb3-type subunit III
MADPNTPPPIDPATNTATTGHEWDGITELDTPLPRWWLILFYATIVAAAIYWVLMPAWPTLNGYTPGLRGHSDRAELKKDLAALDAERGGRFQLIAEQPVEAVFADAGLRDFAKAAGASLFGDNCAQCHRSGGAGGFGFPSLADNVWLWGGRLSEIETTLRHGIRSGDPDARISAMPAYGGENAILTPQQISDTADYVLSLSSSPHDAVAAGRGKAAYEANCVICHGATGAGDRAQGAPALSDQTWLYAGTKEDIIQQMTLGRNGVMPAFSQRLKPEQIKALAVYVWTLGGGENDPPPAPAQAPAPAPAAPKAAPLR